jgi:hypothetical protein
MTLEKMVGCSQLLNYSGFGSLQNWPKDLFSFTSFFDSDSSYDFWETDFEN